MPAVQNLWVQSLTLMQQSVLFSAIRAPDGFRKHHPSKDIMRYYRRCVLTSAFDQAEIRDPFDPRGGSFSGPVKAESLEAAADNFVDARDEMTLHFYGHALHAFEIIGYKHPDPAIRAFWHELYTRMSYALHLWPEGEAEMDARLGDDRDGWLARSDPSTTCSD